MFKFSYIISYLKHHMINKRIYLLTLYVGETVVSKSWNSISFIEVSIFLKLFFLKNFSFRETNDFLITPVWSFDVFAFSKPSYFKEKIINNYTVNGNICRTIY